MKQVLRKGFAQIVVTDVPDPVVIPHHVLVRPHYSLISSGTETASIHTEGVLKEVADNPSHLQKVWDVMRATSPQGTYDELRARFNAYAVLGYSGAGVVSERHPSVQNLHIGDRVAYGGEGTGHGESVLVGRNLAARIPDAVPTDHACFATLGSIALNAVRISGVGIGDVVVIIGLGLVGQLIAQLARLQGAVVIGADLKQERMELARRMGIDQTVGPAVRESVLSATDGRGADVVIVAAAAKSAAPVQLALDVCRDRGRMVIVGAVEINLPWQDMYLKEIQLFMSRAYGPGSYDPAYETKGQDYPVSYIRWTEHRNMEEFLRLCAIGRVNVAPLITHRFALENAPSAYETIMSPQSSSLAVVLEYPAASTESSAAPAPATTRTAERRVVTSNRSENGIGVALVGASNIAKWAHLPSLKNVKGAYLRAVVSASGARGRSYAERFGAAYCCADFNEALSDPAVEAVVITSRNQKHAGDAVAALRAGKHVFVEKPMALTEEECREVEQAVRDAGKVLFVGFNRRFAPVYLEVKRAMQQRSSPAVIHCRVNSPGIAGGFWMADPAIGGAILGEAVHFVDLMYWLLESEPESVAAWTLPSALKDPIGENNLAASFRFADGSVGNLAYCTVGSKTSGGELVEAFAAGIGAWAEDFKRCSVNGRTRRRKSFLFPRKGYEDQMKAFLSAIQQGTPPAVNVRDGSRATIGCLRMLQAARLEQTCAIDLGGALHSTSG
jgi:predicted dehydrogenase/threonine dehydrogenase-like Zn-dependent dehydrogenase